MATAEVAARRDALLAKRVLATIRGQAALAEANGLLARLASCESGAHAAIERRLAELHEEQDVAERRRAVVDRDLATLAGAGDRLEAARSLISTIDQVWPQLTPANRARLVRTLVERVEVSPEGRVSIELVSVGAGLPELDGQHAVA